MSEGFAECLASLCVQRTLAVDKFIGLLEKHPWTAGSSSGKTALTGKIIQEGVSDNFKMRVLLSVELEKGGGLGAATLIGNSSLELAAMPLAPPPRRAAVAALNDVLTPSIQTTKR